MTAPAAALAADLLTLLDVEAVDTDRWRGGRQRGGVGRVFGGQVVAQALQAAQLSVEGDRPAHSLHAQFLRPGDESQPVLYRVTRDLDGRSFSGRRVVAMQDDRPILTMTASFHRDEDGVYHQDAMPDVPPPEALVDERERIAAIADRIPARWRPILARPRPIEVRAVAPRDLLDPDRRPPRWQHWFRLVAPVEADAATHRAIIAYASDFALMGTAMLPHGIALASPRLHGASLDHAVWFHAPARADEWLLYDTDSPWAGKARGFNRGRVFRRDGVLVASTAQEGLMRLADAAP